VVAEDASFAKGALELRYQRNYGLKVWLHLRALFHANPQAGVNELSDVARCVCKETEDDAYEEFKELERKTKIHLLSSWLTMQVRMSCKWIGDMTLDDNFTTESQLHSSLIDNFLPISSTASATRTL
jgi:hypothetical protein